MQTALLAQIEAGLLGQMDKVDPETAIDVTARFFGYSGLILNLGATLSSVLLLLIISSVPTHARRLYLACKHGYPRKFHNYARLPTEPPEPKPEDINANPYAYLDTSRYDDDPEAAVRIFNRELVNGRAEDKILDAFGVARSWGFMRWHSVFCFLSGCVCTFAHVTLLLWMNEATVTAAILMPVVAVGFFPQILIYIFAMDPQGCRYCEEEKPKATPMRSLWNLGWLRTGWRD
ncbi:hypothetical protein EIP91_010884 [Steccherinum ochraceum]|uniref:Uncharacterized protein n=1 Tax=Steccherinum ochraceum TaxID=92696 RepID=A0A4R0RQB0_9APHY|nr:hypothetical protein EIP91_010884 [Steccherinum ochraceum]